MFKVPKFVELIPAVLLFLMGVLCTYLAFTSGIYYISIAILMFIISVVLSTHSCKIMKNGLRKIYIKNGYLFIEFIRDSIEQKYIKKIEDILKIDYKLDSNGVLHIFVEDKENNNCDVAFYVFDRSSYLYCGSIVDIISRQISNKPYKHLLYIKFFLDYSPVITIFLIILLVIFIAISS